MSDLQDLYREIILDHSRTPLRHGLGDNHTAQSHQMNPICGDEVTVAVTVEGDAVTDIRWDGHGCAISQASSSLMSELLAGMTIDEIRDLASEFRTALRSRGEIALDEERFGDAAALSGASRYVARVKCAMLPWVAVEESLGITPDPV